MFKNQEVHQFIEEALIDIKFTLNHSDDQKYVLKSVVM